jgi:hypothetical protein
MRWGRRVRYEDARGRAVDVGTSRMDGDRSARSERVSTRMICFGLVPLI